MKIRIFDNFLSDEEQDEVMNYCEYEARYRYGESDDGTTPPCGVTHNLPKDSSIYKLFAEKTKSLAPKDTPLYRMYINCFAPGELPYFHNDGEDGVTFLYYPQDEWKPNDGGETQFIINGNIQGVVPIPNRLVSFDAFIVHRATSFRDRWRFTVAIKYGDAFDDQCD